MTIFAKGLEFLHVVFNVIEKRGPVFLSLVFASFIKTGLVESLATRLCQRLCESRAGEECLVYFPVPSVLRGHIVDVYSDQ